MRKSTVSAAQNSYLNQAGARMGGPGGMRRGIKPTASNSSNLSGTGREDGSSMAQSRIYEEEEESKHMSSNDNDEVEAQSRGQQSEDISTDSDEDDDDEDILIKPKDLIVSFNLSLLAQII